MTSRVLLSNDDAVMLNAEIARLHRALVAERKSFNEYRNNSHHANQVVAAVVRWRMCSSDTSPDEFALRKLAVLTAGDRFVRAASPAYVESLLRKSAQLAGATAEG